MCFCAFVLACVCGCVCLSEPIATHGSIGISSHSRSVVLLLDGAVLLSGYYFTHALPPPPQVSTVAPAVPGQRVGAETAVITVLPVPPACPATSRRDFPGPAGPRVSRAPTDLQVSASMKPPECRLWCVPDSVGAFSIENRNCERKPLKDIGSWLSEGFAANCYDPIAPEVGSHQSRV